MRELLMSVRIENGECLSGKPFLFDSHGYTNRDDFVAHCMRESMIVSVQELQECIEGQVFEEDEDVLVKYTTEEVIELLRYASIPFLWFNMPDALRQMFATKAVIPISRKMKPLDQAMVVLQHLKNSHNKRGEWKHLLDKHLTVVEIPSLGCNLKAVVLHGTTDDVLRFVNESIYQFENSMMRKEVYAGYLFASYSSFFDDKRAEYWLDSTVERYDPDLRFLEAVVHSMQHIVFFRTKVDSRVHEKGDLLQRIRHLEEEVRLLHEQHSNEIHELLQIISTFTRGKQREQNEDSDTHKCLEGRKIAVVGDDVRQPVYRLLLEREGAIPIFIPGFEKLRLGAERFNHVDGVIFITAYSSHSLYYALKARRSMRHTVLVNHCGVKSFQDGIAQLCAMFASA